MDLLGDILEVLGVKLEPPGPLGGPVVAKGAQYTFFLLFFWTVLGAGLGPKRDQKVTKKADEEWEPKKTERKTFHDGFGPYSARCARPNVL